MLSRRNIVLPLILAFILNGLTLASPPAVEVAQAASTVVYNLYATDAVVGLADGTQVYNYGFVGGRAGEPLTFQRSLDKGGGNVTLAGGAPAPTGGLMTAAETPLWGNAQFPAPVIYATTGDVVEIRLKNLGVSDPVNIPNDPHTIHLHGLDVNAANDGVPETSVAAVPANSDQPGAGNVVVYMFSPSHPGTYMYHCHQEADIHVQMGMFGALVVYEPTDGAYLHWFDPVNNPTASGGTLMGHTWTKENILLLSEFDVNQHISEQQGAGGNAAFNPVNYHPQYWSINGLSFPQTIHVAPPVIPAGTTNWFDQIWIRAHPGYDPLIVGSVGALDKVLVRMINMGFETQPMHMHGFHGKIIGSDQRAWNWIPSLTGEGLEKNTVTIGSGETYEWLLDYSVWSVKGATGNYETGTESRYFNNVGTCAGILNMPVPNGRTDCPAIPDPGVVPPASYIGGPAVGPVIPNPDGGSLPGQLLTMGGVTPFTGQLFPFHNHDDYKATNNGVYPGGQFTMIATVP
jgi:FtsP/CotA-like multicopper oxidase with cupredoxin domain